MLNAKHLTLFASLLLSGSLLAADVPQQGPVQPQDFRQSARACLQSRRDVVNSVNSSLEKIQQVQNESNADQLKAALSDAQNTLKKVQNHFNTCPAAAVQPGMRRGMMRGRAAQQQSWSTVPGPARPGPQSTSSEQMQY